MIAIMYPNGYHTGQVFFVLAYAGRYHAIIAHKLYLYDPQRECRALLDRRVGVFLCS